MAEECLCNVVASGYGYSSTYDTDGSCLCNTVRVRKYLSTYGSCESGVIAGYGGCGVDTSSYSSYGTTNSNNSSSNSYSSCDGTVCSCNSRSKLTSYADSIYGSCGYCTCDSRTGTKYVADTVYGSSSSSVTCSCNSRVTTTYSSCDNTNTDTNSSYGLCGDYSSCSNTSSSCSCNSRVTNTTSSGSSYSSCGDYGSCGGSYSSYGSCGTYASYTSCGTPCACNSRTLKGSSNTDSEDDKTTDVVDIPEGKNIPELTETDIEDVQYNTLWDTTENNSKLPATSSNRTNKALKTSNKRIITAINELVTSNSSLDKKIDEFNERFNQVMGNEVTDPSLLTDVNELGGSALAAITGLYNLLKEYDTNLTKATHDMQSLKAELTEKIESLESSISNGGVSTTSTANTITELVTEDRFNEAAQMITLAAIPKDSSNVKLLVNNVQYFAGVDFIVDGDSIYWAFTENNGGFNLNLTNYDIHVIYEVG